MLIYFLQKFGAEINLIERGITKQAPHHHMKMIIRHLLQLLQVETKERVVNNKYLLPEKLKHKMLQILIRD